MSTEQQNTKKKTKKFIIEMQEKGRALVAISHNYIGFNTTGHMEFENWRKAANFIQRQIDSGHFYDFSYLRIVPAE